MVMTYYVSFFLPHFPVASALGVFFFSQWVIRLCNISVAESVRVCVCVCECVAVHRKIKYFHAGTISNGCVDTKHTIKRLLFYCAIAIISPNIDICQCSFSSPVREIKSLASQAEKKKLKKNFLFSYSHMEYRVFGSETKCGNICVMKK